MVAMSQEQADLLEHIGVQMMRLDDDRAMKLLSLSLAYKFAKPLEAPLPSNVVSIVDRIGNYSQKVGS
jgi:hypothetical protein